MDSFFLIKNNMFTPHSYHFEMIPRQAVADLTVYISQLKEFLLQRFLGFPDCKIQLNLEMDAEESEYIRTFMCHTSFNTDNNRSNYLQLFLGRFKESINRKCESPILMKNACVDILIESHSPTATHQIMSSMAHKRKRLSAYMKGQPIADITIYTINDFYDQEDNEERYLEYTKFETIQFKSISKEYSVHEYEVAVKPFIIQKLQSYLDKGHAEVKFRLFDNLNVVLDEYDDDCDTTDATKLKSEIMKARTIVEIQERFEEAYRDLACRGHLHGVLASEPINGFGLRVYE